MSNSPVNRAVVRDAAFDMAGLLSGSRSEEYGREVAEQCAQDRRYRQQMEATAELLADMSELEGSEFIEGIVSRPIRSRRVPRLAVAAGFLLMATAGWFAFLQSTDDAAPLATERYVTGIGKQKEIVLADGSMLHLNTNTEVLVSMDQSSRQLILKRGEAFFDVVKNPHSPFTVDVGAHTVTVLGTSFNLFKEPGLVSVSVADGVVAIHRPDESIESTPELQLTGTDSLHLSSAGQYKLIAGQRMELRQSGSVLTTLPKENVGLWRGGLLSFIDAPLYQVVKELNRYSAKKILIEDAKIMNLPISATIKVDRIGASVRRFELAHDIVAKHYVDRIVLVGK